MKSHICIACLVILLLCTSCTGEKQNDVEKNEWLSYQNIVVGDAWDESKKDSYGELYDIDELDMLNMKTYRYDGFSVIVQDDIVRTITISGNQVPAYNENVVVGATIDMVMELLPEQLEEIYYTELIPGAYQENEIDGIGYYYFVEKSKLDESILSRELVIHVEEEKVTTTISFDENEVVKEIRIVFTGEE